MDFISAERRSAIMSRIPNKNTRPEQRVRRVAHRLGLRFRLHRQDLPGSPDIVFPRRQTAVFVHGCYWHRHPGCKLAYEPKSNVDFWSAKFARNVARDARVQAELNDLRWNVVVIWECETRSDSMIADALQEGVLNAGC